MTRVQSQERVRSFRCLWSAKSYSTAKLHHCQLNLRNSNHSPVHSVFLVIAMGSFSCFIPASNNAEAAATAALRYELEVRKKQIENLSEELARMVVMEQEARTRSTISLINYRSLLSDRMRRLLRDATVTDEEITQLAALCATELGLSSFSRTLKRAVKKSSSMVLCDRNFRQLLTLCHAVLDPAERNGSSSTDLMSAQVIMQCACAIVRRRAEGGFEYLRDHIKGCAVWRSDRYWVDVFWQEVRFLSHANMHECRDTNT